MPIYVDTRDPSGATPLVCSVDVDPGQVCFPRIARLLVDAGADTTSAVRVTGIRSEVLSNATPLDLTNYILRQRKRGFSTEEQLNRFEAVRRLLLPVDAAHAISCLWPRDFRPITNTQEAAHRTKTPSAPLIIMVQIIRQRASRRRVLLTALFRWVVMCTMPPIPVRCHGCCIMVTARCSVGVVWKISATDHSLTQAVLFFTEPAAL